MIQLTDEEIQNITDNIACSFIGAVANSGLDFNLIVRNAIAKAQLKKVLGWGEVSCGHDMGGYYGVKRWACPICRQALLEEVDND